MPENPSTQFYQNIDRDTVYSSETNPDRHPFYRMFLDYITKYDLKDSKLLEIGSSKGLFQDLVADYTGLDISSNLSKYYHRNFVVASGSHLPFVSESFEGIFTYATYEHIPEIETALEEIIRILKTGGICLFAPAWHTRSWFAKGYPVRPYAKLSFKEKIIKFSICFKDFFLFRGSFVFCRRLFHLVKHFYHYGKVRPLEYKKLEPNYDVYWQSDSDACNSLDPFDVVLWFKTRGIFCNGYEGWLKMLFIRTYALELQKK
jgi:SAM-dependent methyltransferase